MSLKFVPPKEDGAKFPRYAVYSDGKMTTHGTMRGAKSSWNNRSWTYVEDPDAPKDYYGRSRKKVTRHSFILESVDGEWFVRYEVKPGLTFDQLPWVKQQWNAYGYWNDMPMSDYHQKLVDRNERSVKYRHVNKRVTPEEYADWRVAVEYERLGIER